MKGYSDIPRSVDSSRKLSARKRKMKSCGLRVPPKVEHGFGAEIGDWVVWVARMTRRLSGWVVQHVCHMAHCRIHGNDDCLFASLFIFSSSHFFPLFMFYFWDWMVYYFALISNFFRIILDFIHLLPWFIPNTQSVSVSAPEGCKLMWRIM